MVKFEDYVFMFGGIEAITKEKNDIYIFSLEKTQWSKIHTTTNSIYDCSPTLKKSQKVCCHLLRRKTLTPFLPKESLPKSLKGGPMP
jgi:hypothetical protein